MVDAEDGSFTALAETGVFNLQQGSMLHWIDAGHGEELTWNTWQDGWVVSHARALPGEAAAHPQLGRTGCSYQPRT